VLLLDTNALSEILRKKPHAGFMRRALAHGAEVVSRNDRHLGKIPGLIVHDWWI
jgi:predicted nucleic acid-binding protein